MNISNPVQDYIKKSTFPDAADILALNGSSIDFIKKSTFSFIQFFPATPLILASLDTGGIGLNASGRAGYVQGKVLSAIFTLTAIKIVGAQIGAGGCGDVNIELAWNTEGNSYQLLGYANAKLAIGNKGGNAILFAHDITSLITLPPANSYIGGFCAYQAVAPATSFQFRGLELTYTLT